MSFAFSAQLSRYVRVLIGAGGGGVSIRMDKYVSNTIEKFPEDITAPVVMPEAYYLFDASTTVTRLKETEVSSFHRSTERLLFMCKISNPDVHPVVAFLTTSIKETMDEDWKNLVWFLVYLKGML